MKKIILLIFLGINFHITFAQWAEQTSSVSSNLKDVFFVNQLEGYAVSNQANYLLKTTDGGIFWFPVGTTNNANTCWFTSSSIGFYAGINNQIKKTNDGGLSTSTTFIESPYLPLEIKDINFINPIVGFATGYINWGSGFMPSGKVYKTTDAGISWVSIHPNSYPFWGVSFTSPDTGYVVGGSTIQKTENGGSSWTILSTGLSTSNFILISVSFLPHTNIGYCVGADWSVPSGIILKTTDGVNWSNITPSICPKLNSVNFIDPNNGIVVGDSGIILKTIDGGLNWNQDISPVSENFNSVFYLDTNNAWIVGNNGKILHSSNPSSIEKITPLDDISIFPNPSNDVFTITQKNNDELYINIYNSLGESIYRKNTSDLVSLIDLNTHSKGVYYISIMNNKKNSIIKKVILN